MVIIFILIKVRDYLLPVLLRNVVE